MEAVRILGLTELRLDMERLVRELPTETKKTDLKAAQLVAREARSKAQSGVAHHVAPSIAAVATSTNAELTWGGDQYPMAGGAEFGSIRYHQFKPYRGPDEGYFIMPAVRDTADQVVELYGSMIDDAF